MDLPIFNSTTENEKTFDESGCKSSSSTVSSKLAISKPPNKSPTKHFWQEIEKDQPPKLPLNIKIEEPLIITDTTQIQSQPVIDENPSKMAILNHYSDLSESLNSQKSAQGSLNEISDIFKDAVPTRVEPTSKVGTENLKIPTVQQKKTLVKCLDSNGKIIFVELQVDPNNPKNIKIIKNLNSVTTTSPASLNQNQPKGHAIGQQLNLNSPLQPIPARPTHLSNILSNTPSVSIMPKQSIGAEPILNQKAIVVQGHSRFDSNQIQHSFENKKIFIIQSSALKNVNVNSTNPPPLVRISNPSKVTVAPSMTNLKATQASPKPTETRKLTINSSNVIIKNGQIIILDRDKSQNPKPKQESLLKPQISLLKPLPNKPTSESTIPKMPKTNSIHGSRQFRKQLPTNQINTKRDYHKEFCTAFLRHHFQTVRTAVEYLLKNAPLINILSNKLEFSEAFPFVVESHQKFSSFSLPKRRSNEVQILG